jgi:hypothetical protein
MLVALMTQALAGALVPVRHGNARMACCADDASSESEAACHTQGTSPAESPAATICCETFCGRGASGSQFETVPQISTPALNSRLVRAELPELFPDDSAFSLMPASFCAVTLPHYSYSNLPFLFSRA